MSDKQPFKKALTENCGNLNDLTQNSSNPQWYCIDCTVLFCDKLGDDKYHAKGSTNERSDFICDRPKRMYDWKEIEKWKKRN